MRALKPGGRLVFVEYRAEDPRVPIKPLHKMSEAQIRREAEVHPLAWERTVEHLAVAARRDLSQARLSLPLARSRCIEAPRAA